MQEKTTDVTLQSCYRTTFSDILLPVVALAILFFAFWPLIR